MKNNRTSQIRSVGFSVIVLFAFALFCQPSAFGQSNPATKSPATASRQTQPVATKDSPTVDASRNKTASGPRQVIKLLKFKAGMPPMERDPRPDLYIKDVRSKSNLDATVLIANRGGSDAGPQFPIAVELLDEKGVVFNLRTGEAYGMTQKSLPKGQERWVNISTSGVVNWSAKEATTIRIVVNAPYEVCNSEWGTTGLVGGYETKCRTVNGIPESRTDNNETTVKRAHLKPIAN